jgi:hypothetical protein
MDVVRGPSYGGRNIHEDIRKWGPEKNFSIYTRVKATGGWGKPLTTPGLMICITQKILKY